MVCLKDVSVVTQKFGKNTRAREPLEMGFVYTAYGGGQ
jgi:hypothetical protein